MSRHVTSAAMVNSILRAHYHASNNLTSCIAQPSDMYEVISLAGKQDHSHPIANALVAFTGVAYFAAWSISFYPQIILNYKRKK